MEFVETPIFTREIAALLTDDAYAELQHALVSDPRAGTVIPGTGGLRKLRWRSERRGKRGGIRVIYYCWSANRLYMLFAYEKSVQGDLTHAQLRRLQAHVMGGML